MGDGTTAPAAHAPPRQVPHYALATVSHSAPEYVNHEQDLIRQSFSSGNHTWMKEALPVELRPDSVNVLRRQRMERNRLAEPSPRSFAKLTQLWGGGASPEFEYMPDDYERKHQLELQDKRISAEMRANISNLDWRHPAQGKRLKYEPSVIDPRSKETYPYLGGDKDQEMQLSSQAQGLKNWLRSGPDRKPDAGPPRGVGDHSFLAGRGRGLEDESRTSRMTLPTIVSRLQRRLAADWEGSTAIVSVTDQDLVQIAYHMPTIDSERGVMAYMNVLSKDVDLVGTLGLRKVSQLWGMTRDFASENGHQDMAEDYHSKGGEDDQTWMFFLFMPKWVRMRPTDAYYTVHPRSQGSAFRMSTAGSSVLLSMGASVVEVTDGSRRQENAGNTLAPGSSQGAGRGVLAQTGGRLTARSQLGGSGKMDLSIIEQALTSMPKST